MTQSVTIEPINTGESDISGTITAADTAQDIADARTQRRGFWVQNLSAVPLWIMVGADAVAGQPSIKVNPDALYESPVTGCSNGRISVISSLEDGEFSAREW